MRMARATLETTLGCGHSWDGLRLCELGASVRVHTLNPGERRLVAVLPRILRAKQF